MMPIYKNTLNKTRTKWFSRPRPEHIVQYYRSDRTLLPSLAEYMYKGLARGDTCIMIATPAHSQAVSLQLTSKGINVTAAILSRQYIVLDAENMLAKFLVDDLPDRGRFAESVGSLIADVSSAGNPVCAYGEMVALLWRDGNKQAVIQLENLWNELAARFDFSLYCAYPELHFVMDKDVLDEISSCHDCSYSDSQKRLSPSLSSL